MSINWQQYPIVAFVDSNIVLESDSRTYDGF